MKTIGFDLDGVLYNWVRMAHKHLQVFHGLEVDFVELFTNEDKYLTEIGIRNLLDNPLIYNRTNIPPQDLNVLYELYERYNIVYITARPRHLKLSTAFWLERCKAPNHKELYFTDFEKRFLVSELECDFYIEDRSRHLEELKGITNLILMRTPFNRDYWDKFPSIRSIEEIPVLLKELGEY